MIGLDVGEAETEAFWRAFLRSLPAVAWTASSSPSPTRTPAQAGDHPGAGWAWQRCCVQVLRDMLGHLARAQQPLGSGAIGGSFTATTAAARMWGDLPNHAALLRLAGMLLLEQNDEWLVGRCYLSETAMALVMATDHPASSPQPAPR